MATQGTLQDIALADLIQQYCQNRKTAQVTLTSKLGTSELYFKDGQVTHATLGDLQGEEVVYKVLTWSEGRFNLEPGIESPRKTIQRSWSGLILEGARRLDEARIPDNEIQSNPTTQQEVKQMELDNVLKELSDQIQGFMSAGVIGMDGISITSLARGKKTDTDTVSAQMTLLIKLVDSTTTKLNAGAVEDNLLTTENAYLLVRFLKDRNFFLGIAADRKTAQLGNMRLVSRLFAERLSKAMPH